MAVCWGLDLLVVAGLKVPETRGVSANPWAEVIHPSFHTPQVVKLFSTSRTLAFLAWAAMVGFCFGESQSPSTSPSTVHFHHKSSPVGSMGLHFWLLEDLGGRVETCEESRGIKLLQVFPTTSSPGPLPVSQLPGRDPCLLPLWAPAGVARELLVRAGPLPPPRAMTGVLVAHALRLLYYSAMSAPWQVLPVELIQGVTFGLFFPTLVSVSARVAPPGAPPGRQGVPLP